MPFGIDDFKGNFIIGARPCYFRVVMDSPPPGISFGGKEEFMIKAASLPSYALGDVDVPYQGQIIPVAGNKTYEPWTITVINDTDFLLFNQFRQWMQKAEALDTANGAIDWREYKETEATITQLDHNEAEIAEFKFVGLYPNNVSAIDTAWETRDTIEEFQVTFRFDYYDEL